MLRLLALGAVLAAAGGGGPVDREPAGRSPEGRVIQLYRFGAPDARFRLLVFGCVHGNECAGTAVTRRLLRADAPAGVEVYVVQNLNPDGFVRGVRQNARGVDLNRNFGSEWRRLGRRWSPQYSGPRPWSEPETRLAPSPGPGIAVGSAACSLPAIPAPTSSSGARRARPRR